MLSLYANSGGTKIFGVYGCCCRLNFKTFLQETLDCCNSTSPGTALTETRKEVKSGTQPRLIPQENHCSKQSPGGDRAIMTRDINSTHSERLLCQELGYVQEQTDTFPVPAGLMLLKPMAVLFRIHPHFIH